MKPGGPFEQYAAHMLDGGYSPVPLIVGEKRPLPVCAFYQHWNVLKEKALTPQEIAALSEKYPALGLGVAGGFDGLIPVDIDVNERQIISAVLSVIPPPTVAKKGRKGITAFYWNPSGEIRGIKFRRPRDGGGFDMLLEILATGQSAIPPTIHPDLGEPYRWITPRTIFNECVDELPIITSAHIDALREALEPWLPRPALHMWKSHKPNRVVTDARMTAYARAALASEARSLAGLSCGRNWELYCAGARLGKFVHNRILTQSEVEDAMMSATQSNGYASAKHGGMKKAFATLRSGLKTAIDDPLPDLAGKMSNQCDACRGGCRSGCLSRDF
jgi:hypothetical protein